ncbi:MAG: tail fiber domain-containing protein [Terriglobia bacterium]
MTRRRISVWLGVVFVLGTVGLRARSGVNASVVPRLIKFSGEVNPQISQIKQIRESEDGKGQMPTLVGLSLSLYELQEGGSPLWSEAQKVRVDEEGRYTVLLGATQADGLPLDLFTSGKALWLGVQPQLPGATEQPRVLLVAVPYALKASDSDTLGGKPASAYALASPALSAANGVPLTAAVPAAQPITDARQPTTDNRQPTTDNQQPASSPQPLAPCPAVTSDGTATANSITMFTTNCNLEASAMTQTSGNIGISGASPANTKFQITDTPAANFGIHYLNHELLNSSVTANGTNKGLTFVMDATNMSILTGVTDSGYRVGVEGAAYANTAGFAGTLAIQYGVWGRAGISTATAGATVSNAYAGYFDIFNSMAGTTITNAYGVYIANSATTGTITNRYDLYASSANGKSYFAGNVGIGTTTPAAKLEVNGTTKFDSSVTVTGLAAGKCVQAGAGGLLTTTASPCGSGGGGGVSQITAGTDITISPAGGTGNVTVNLTSAACGAGQAAVAVPFACSSFATLGANTFAGTQTIGSGDLSVGNGNFDLPNTTGPTVGVINLGGNPFIHECCFASGGLGYTNTFVGLSAGNFSPGGTLTASYQTAIGANALRSNSTGAGDTASGGQALQFNTTGSLNTASGEGALFENTTGNNNTASGVSALQANTTGNNNTAVGSLAGVTSNFALPTTGSNSTFVGANATATVDGLTNATAIGYNAQVAESNALVLGNGAMVGIGTSTPQYTLDVHGTGNFTGAVKVAGLTAGDCVQAGAGGLLTTVASACGSGGGGGGVSSVTGGGGVTASPTTGAVVLGLANVPNAALTNSSVSLSCTGLTCDSSVALGGTLHLTAAGGGGGATLGPNTFTGTQTIASGDVSVGAGNLDLPGSSGTVAGGLLLSDMGTINIASTNAQNSPRVPFVHECCFVLGVPTYTNTFIGISAGNFTSTGNGNTGSGGNALEADSTGSLNTASGFDALVSNTTGSQNTASGGGSLQDNTMGTGNTASGYQALYANSAGSNNTASGGGALYSNTTGSNNTAIGHIAGTYSGFYPTTGSNSTFVGANATATVDGLTNATAIGYAARVSESNALVLGAINDPVGNPLTTNVGIGTSSPAALLDVEGGTAVNGQNGVGLRLVAQTGGSGASEEAGSTGGSINISSGNGGAAGTLAAGGLGGSINITAGAGAAGSLGGANGGGGSVYIIPGAGGSGFGATPGPAGFVILTPPVGIGTGSPDDDLTVNGTADKPGGGSWGTFSDGRLKTVDGAFRSGLNQVLNLNPVRYRYNEGNALGIHDHGEHIGVVAQEVQNVIPEAVTADNQGYLIVNNDPIIWSMLNAIKQQQAEIERLKSEVAEQRKQTEQQQAAMKQLLAHVHGIQVTLAGGRSARPHRRVARTAHQATKPEVKRASGQAASSLVAKVRF